MTGPTDTEYDPDDIGPDELETLEPADPERDATDAAHDRMAEETTEQVRKQNTEAVRPAYRPMPVWSYAEDTDR